MFNKKLKQQISDLETKLSLLKVQNTFLENQNKKSKMQIKRMHAINAELIGKNMLLREIANKIAPGLSNCVN